MGLAIAPESFEPITRADSLHPKSSMFVNFVGADRAEEKAMEKQLYTDNNIQLEREFLPSVTVLQEPDVP